MKTNLSVLLTIALLLGLSSAGAAEEGSSLLTKARVARELGDLDEAARLFGEVEGAGAPEATKIEALLGLGQIEQERGRPEESLAAFRKVAEEAKDDLEVRWRLAEAVTRVTPDARGWLEGQYAAELGEGRHGELPVAVMLWPAARGLFGDGVFVGQPISMSLKRAALTEVLRSFEMITGRKITWESCVEEMRVAMALESVPWDRALYDILGSRGLSATEEEGLLRVTCPEETSLELPEGRTVRDDIPVASFHARLGSVQIPGTEALCRSQPVHEVKVSKVPKASETVALGALTGVLRDLVQAEGVGRLEICGSAGTLEEMGGLQRQLSDASSFFGPTFREVRPGDPGGYVFRMTAYWLPSSER